MFEAPYSRHARPIAMAAVLSAVLLPILWLLISATLSDSAVLAAHMPTVSDISVGAAFARLVTDARLKSALAHSCIVASFAATLSTICGAACAIAIAACRRRLRVHTTNLVFAFRFLPAVVLIPFYYWALGAIGAIDQLYGIVIAHTMIGAGFAALCIVPAALGVRTDDVQQALLEGAKLMPTIAISVILPKVRTALVVAWCFSFMASWNELLLASFLSESPRSQLVSLYCFSAIGQYRIDFQGLAIGGALSLLPCFLGVISWSWILQRLSITSSS